jgi:hypothetical protein
LEGGSSAARRRITESFSGIESFYGILVSSWGVGRKKNVDHLI